MIFRYKIAEIVFEADIRYRFTYNVMKDYLVDDEPARFSIVISDEDIEKEKNLSPYDLNDASYESTAVYRKFIYEVMESTTRFSSIVLLSRWIIRRLCLPLKAEQEKVLIVIYG